jgi:hypothetical protein
MRRKSPSVSAIWKETTGTNAPASFFEWIMGIPIGATESEPAAVQWYRSKLKQRSKFLRDTKKEAARP